MVNIALLKLYVVLDWLYWKGFWMVNGTKGSLKLESGRITSSSGQGTIKSLNTIEENSGEVRNSWKRHVLNPQRGRSTREWMNAQEYCTLFWDSCFSGMLLDAILKNLRLWYSKWHIIVVHNNILWPAFPISLFTVYRIKTRIWKTTWMAQLSTHEVEQRTTRLRWSTSALASEKWIQLSPHATHTDRML